MTATEFSSGEGVSFEDEEDVGIPKSKSTGVINEHALEGDKQSYHFKKKSDVGASKSHRKHKSGTSTPVDFCL